MAFLNRISGVLKQTVSKNMNMEFSASNTSLYQAIRSMSSSKLFVGGISWSTDEMSLKEAFSQHGEVLEARIITDRDTGRSRGFGFVTFTSSDEANSAIQAFDGQELHGRQIRVNFATEKPRGEGFGGGGGYGGGGGGYGGGGGGYGGGGGGYAGGNYGGGGGYGGNTGGYGGNTGGYGGTTPSSYGGSGGGGYGTSGVAPPAGGGDYYNSGVAPPAGGGDFYNSGVAPPAGGGDFYNSGVAPPASGGDYYNSGNTGYAGTTTQATFDEGQRGPTSSNVADEFNDDTVEGNDRDENDGPGDDYANTRA